MSVVPELQRLKYAPFASAAMHTEKYDMYGTPSACQRDSNRLQWRRDKKSMPYSRYEDSEKQKEIDLARARTGDLE